MNIPKPPAALLAAGLLAGALAGPQAADAAVTAKVTDQVLTVSSNGAKDDISLRLAAGDPQTLQVVSDGTRPYVFSFPKASVTRIDVRAGGGDDRVRIDDTGGAFTTSIPTALSGGSGDDTILGGQGAETLDGGNGDDFVDGGAGADTVTLGRGDDRFQWDPGEGSDKVEGGKGYDTMVFNGADVAERFDVSRNGGRVRFFRDIGSITMDLDDVEEIDTAARGGADSFTSGDLSGTGLTELRADLGATGGGDDRAADLVAVNATPAADSIIAAGGAGTASVTGLAARIDITHAVVPGDLLSIDGLAGDDIISGSGLTADAIGFKAAGGDGDDVLVGGAGDDTLLGGLGNDTLDGGSGANVIIQ